MNREYDVRYTSEKFETYNDWFYFIHVDLYLRIVHALEMVLGPLYYIFSVYTLWIHGVGPDFLG